MRLALLPAAMAVALSGGCSLHRASAEEGNTRGVTSPGALAAPPAPAASTAGVELPAPLRLLAPPAASVSDPLAASGASGASGAAGAAGAPVGPGEAGAAGQTGNPLSRMFDRETRPARQWAYISTAAGETCREALKATGAKFRVLPDVTKPNRNGCGVPHGVLLTRGPTGITYSPPIQVDCSFALRLPEVERILQEEAKEHLGAELSRVVTLGSYACRPVVGRLAGRSGGISEHSFGNAVDIARFEPKRGRSASVMRDYQSGEEPKTEPTRFLRDVVRRLRGEGAIRRVLGPDFDASHRDHLHLDQGTRWWQ
ncbi:extensin-like domain-containing protein [Chondromyces apiculatus]|nr:extensin family protein [Chondromyces apiculatus]